MASKVINTILNLKDNTSSKLVKVSKNVSGMSKDMQRASAGAAGFANKFAAGTKKIVAGSVKLVAAGAAIAGAFLLKGAVSTYADFEQSMANVKALSMATGKTFDDLKNKALEMGKKTSKTAKEAADALGYMSLAGWSAEDSMKGLEPVLRLSEAGQSDLAYTSDLVTDSMSAMGLQVDDLSGYLDKVAQTSRKSNTNTTQMMEAFNGVGGIIKNLNIPLEESGALLGMLANRSIKGSEAGNKLSSLMINLTTGAGQAGKALKSIGMSAFDSQGKFKGVTKVLNELNEKTKNLTEQQRNKIFAQVGGKTQVDTLNALMSGINTVTDSGATEFEYLKKVIGESDGALMEMANTMNATMMGAWKRLQSAVDDFKIRFISTLAPYITPAIDKLAAYIPTVTERVTKKIIKIIEQIKGPVKAVAKFLSKNWDLFAAVAAGAVAFVMVDKAVRAFSVTLKVLNVIMGLFNKTLVLTPFGWAVVAAVALAAAFVILWKRSETFRKIVKSLLSKLKDLAVGLGGAIVKAAKKLGQIFQTYVVPVLKVVGAAFSALWKNVIVPFASWLAGKFQAAAKSMGGGIKSHIVGAVSTAAKVLSGLWNNVLVPVASWLVSTLGPVLVSVGGWIKKHVVPVVAAAAEMFSALWNNVLVPLAKWFVGTFKGAIKGIGDSFKSNVLPVLSALWKNVLVPLGGFIAAVLWPVFKAVFRDIKNGISVVFSVVKGIVEGLLRTFKGILKFLTGIFTGDWRKAWGGIKDIFGGIWDGIKTLAKAPLDWISRKIKNLKKMVSDFADGLKDVPLLGAAVGWVSDKINGHALGTPYYSGGPTRINERGGEIINLPSGTQIIPHDVSVKAAGGNNVTINLTIQGNVIGNRDYMEQVGAYVGQRVIAALGNV